MSLSSKSDRAATNGSSVLPSKTLGLIAGKGSLPKAIAEEAIKRGYTVIAIALQPLAGDSLKPFVNELFKIHIGRLGEVIKRLKEHSITEVVIAGKVTKKLLYQHKKSLVPDLRAVKFLLSLSNRSDDTILNAVKKELEKDNIKLLKATSFTKNLLTTKGVLTRKVPKKDQWNDIEFGWRVAKEIGRLGIGQTIVVKGTAVMAVEAIEGTDEAIIRGGMLAGKDAVVIKVSRPKQSMFMDIPVVGIDTLLSMKKSHAKVLALEAGKSIIVDKENFIKEADRARISIVGISSDKNK